MVHPNKFRFSHPPTIEQIDRVVKNFGTTATQFERIHGIHHGAIKKIRLGLRNMPVKHWHLFLEETPLQTSVDAAYPNQNKTRQSPKIHKPKQVSLKSGSRLSSLLEK